MSRSVLVAFLLCFVSSCDISDPILEAEPPIQFNVLDFSCTETWLQVKLVNGLQPRRCIIQRDTLIIFDGYIASNDTIIIDDGLLSSHYYLYALTRPAGLLTDSATTTFTTLDTTSHNFAWEIDTLDVASGVLLDLAIINDTLAYAVGEMYLRDSSGQLDPQAWNAAKWNGTEWELIRIPFVGPCSAVLYPPLKAIFAISETDILVTNGGSIVRYDGANATMDCGMNTLLAGAINEIWGKSLQDVYAVGNMGTIVHYNGSTWQLLESGTTLPIMDVYGGRDSQSDQYEIVCVAENTSLGESKLLKIAGNSVTEVSTPGLQSWGLWGIWFIPRRKYIVVGDGLWQANTLGEKWFHDFQLPPQFKTSIDGKGYNDVVVCGASWLLGHWNGVGWQTYFPTISNSLTAVQIRNDLIVAVGGIGGKAVVVSGTR